MPAEAVDDAHLPDSKTLNEAATVDEHDWVELVGEIRRGRCTPFLGAGACVPLLPLASELVGTLAEKEPIPERYCDSLTNAAQYLSVTRSPARPKQAVADIIDELLSKIPDNVVRNHSPHAFLARLPLPVYLTTNYDNLMQRALDGERRPYRTDYCRWNRFVDADSELLDQKSTYIPSKEHPLVYHLHGTTDEVDSIVISETDYVDFIVNVARDRLLPNCIKNQLARTELLFIGYSLKDINFRIIVKGVLGALGDSAARPSIAVQLHVDDPSERQYFENYIKQIGTAHWKIYWGDSASFIDKLRSYWEMAEVRP